MTNPSTLEEPVSAEPRREKQNALPIFDAVGRDLADSDQRHPSGGGCLMPPVEVEPRMAVFESELATVKAEVSEIKSELKAFQLEMAREFRELNVKLAGRPSWAVTTIITLLSAAVAGLTVAVATGL